jgi:hypothetical protein
LGLSYTYNKLLKVSQLQGTGINLSYSYAHDGTVSQITDGINSGRIQSFTMDTLNRLSTAYSRATSGTDCWGQSFGYDRYGNLLTVSSTQCSSPTLSLTVSTKNRVTNTGFTYDNAGNLTSDGVNTYQWDAENHLKSTNGVNYTYDGDLRRVEKSNGKLYWYSGGQVLEETDLSGNSEHQKQRRQAHTRRTT